MRLIDADEAYKVLGDYFHTRTEIQHKALKEAIERVPTVHATTAKNATVGHWEKQRNIQKYQISPYVFVCDQCHTVFDIPTPYCGFCGAKMDNTI